MSVNCCDYRVKMCKVEMLRAMLNARLSAAVEEIFGVVARTIAEYEEELSRTKEENERQRQLLDAVFRPQEEPHKTGAPSSPDAAVLVAVYGLFCSDGCRLFE